MPRPPPRSTPFPYTTLFRSGVTGEGEGQDDDADGADEVVVEDRVVLRDHHRGVHHQVHQRAGDGADANRHTRSEEHTSELQSLAYLVCRLLLEKKKNNTNIS